MLDKLDREIIEELLKDMCRVTLPVAIKVLGNTAKAAALILLIMILAIIQLIEYLTPRAIAVYQWSKPRVIRGSKKLAHRIFYYSQNPPKLPEFVPFGIMGL